MGRFRVVRSGWTAQASVGQSPPIKSSFPPWPVGRTGVVTPLSLLLCPQAAPLATVDEVMTHQEVKGDEPAVRRGARAAIESVDRAIDGMGARLVARLPSDCPQLLAEELASGHLPATLSTTKGVCR